MSGRSHTTIGRHISGPGQSDMTLATRKQAQPSYWFAAASWSHLTIHPGCGSASFSPQSALIGLVGHSRLAPLLTPAAPHWLKSQRPLDTCVYFHPGRRVISWITAGGAAGVVRGRRWPAINSWYCGGEKVCAGATLEPQQQQAVL